MLGFVLDRIPRRRRFVVTWVKNGETADHGLEVHGTRRGALAKAVEIAAETAHPELEMFVVGEAPRGRV